MAVALLNSIMNTEHVLSTNGPTAATTIEPPTPSKNDVAPISLDDRVREFEAGLIRWALTVARGNKSQAARLLQIKRSTLGDRINRCGLGSHTGTGDVRS
jgi:DNA-binding NtrC family response regulator